MSRRSRATVPLIGKSTAKAVHAEKVIHQTGNTAVREESFLVTPQTPVTNYVSSTVHSKHTFGLNPY